MRLHIIMALYEKHHTYVHVSLYWILCCRGGGKTFCKQMCVKQMVCTNVNHTIQGACLPSNLLNKSDMSCLKNQLGAFPVQYT